MDIVLPREINYSNQLPALPECLSQEIVLAPVNGASFAASSLIQFDLPSRGFLDPASLYIRYKCKITNNSTETSTIFGTPVYTFFNKLEVLFGSSIVENINNYGQICNMWTNLQLSVADKYGMQTAFGYGMGSANVPSLEQLDGRSCINNEEFTVSAPLPCILSASERLIPLGLMPNVRVQLTVDAVKNIMKATTIASTSFALTNIELCYTMIDFNGNVNDIVKSMGEQFYIKSTSFQSIGSSLSTGVSGNMELVYNLRLASIKSLFTSFVGSHANCVNGLYDSIDITSANGELVYNIAGTYYPSRPVSTLNNKAAVLSELKKAVGALHSNNFNFSINQNEFNACDSTPPNSTTQVGYAVTTTATTVTAPGKFWFGVNTEKLSTNGALLTGISTQNSPITLRISTGTATAMSYTVYLTAMFDILIAIDPHNRQATVKQ